MSRSIPQRIFSGRSGIKGHRNAFSAPDRPLVGEDDLRYRIRCASVVVVYDVLAINNPHVFIFAWRI